MTEQRQGRFLGLPYDWRRPSRERLRQRAWNRADPRIIVPRSFGWGYGINLASLLDRLRGRRSS